MICVKIAVDDNGRVMVGECPPEEAGGEYMQPVQSLEEAMAKAAQMMQGGRQMNGQMPGQMEEKDDDEAEQSFQAGFRRARGAM